MQSYTPEQRVAYNAWLNGVSKLAYQIAGNERAFYALDKPDRTRIRETAKELYDLGADFATAERAERTDKRGFVYAITNPAWPGLVKIGRAFNPESRLNGYQTGSPYRDYRLDYAVYFEDSHATERDIHIWLDAFRVTGEWFRVSINRAVYAIDVMREEAMC